MSFVTENIILISIAVVSGGLLLWPLLTRGAGGPLLDTLAATRLINDSQAVVVDVRPAADFAGGHLPNARNLPLAEFDKRSSELPAGKPVLLYCASGNSAGKAAGALRKAGRGEVFMLAGGLQAWRQAGLPLVK
ncbi:MAG: rhodanese-like domain-containing protein [Burkholderiaceae bacterium]